MGYRPRDSVSGRLTPAAASRMRRLRMARKQVEVTVRGVDAGQIPEDVVEGGVVFADLEARGLVDELAERLRIRRQGGYPAVDLFLVVLLYWMWRNQAGFKSF